MGRNEVKQKSARRPLRDLPNNSDNSGVIGKSSKSMNVTKKSIIDKEIHKQPNTVSTTQQHQQEEDYLDRLLLVQSDLSSLTRQIDELVAQAFNLKITSKEGRREIDSFSRVLSDMLSSLKPWVPRFQKVLSKDPSIESKNQLRQCLADKTISAVNEDEKFEVESPEQTGRKSLISPSPLVSWRADCNVDRGRQLFLLTPLPMSKTLSSKRMDLSKSVFEGVSRHSVADVSSFLTFSSDVNDDLLDGIATKLTPIKPSDLVVTETERTHDSQCISSPVFTKRENVLVMTPCLKMSPPKSCVLLEPVSASTQKGKSMARRATPFPVGKLSQISESSSDSEGSQDLGLKFPELLGIQQACRAKAGKKDLEASPSWLFSPPRTCILLEPPDDKSPVTLAVDHLLPINTPDLNQQENLKPPEENYNQGGGCQIQKPCNQGPIGNSSSLVESTPIWNEPESTFGRGKRPGENTLKKELWTKFEAASTYGVRLNVSALQRTAQKGFLDMLDEVSCDGRSTMADGLR